MFDTTADEYIRLHNVSSESVSLASESASWTLRGGVEFDFSRDEAEATLGPGEYAIVASTSPTIFRERFGIPAEIKIFGPFSGNLDNDGEEDFPVSSWPINIPRQRMAAATGARRSRAVRRPPTLARRNHRRRRGSHAYFQQLDRGGPAELDSFANRTRILILVTDISFSKSQQPPPPISSDMTRSVAPSLKPSLAT